MSVEPKSSDASRLLSSEAPPYSAMLGGVRHGFFGRRGGVSAGIYASLNAGTGSGDDPAATRENRRRIAAAFGAEHLVGVHQVHSSDAVFVDRTWDGERPHADALVTKTPGLVLSVLTADCAPVLLVDREAGVIGAAHAGWRGAFGGVLGNTVRLMVEHGANAARISAAIGPSIQLESYEVGPEFRERFLLADVRNAMFFPHYHDRIIRFNLPAFCAAQLYEAGLEDVMTSNADTYRASAELFSHRRSVHENLGDYGRNCAAISL